jgi:hypothetical protein
VPLPKGKKNIGRNIAELERSGRKKSQAIAIALDVAREGGADIPKRGKKPRRSSR